MDVFDKERLREETRSGTIVAVGIARPVGVELDLAVVEVEDRRVVEIAIGLRIIYFCPSTLHRILRFTFAS